MRLGGMGLGGAGTVSDGLLLISLAWLFYCIRGSLGFFSIVVFNIVINLSAHYFKLDTSNLHFGLNFYGKSSMDVIFTSCLASFNLHFNGNLSSSIQSSGQVQVAKLFKAISQAICYALEVLIALVTS